MAKSTKTENSPTGIGSDLYICSLGLVSPSDRFTYEVCIYKYGKNEFSLYESKIIKLNKLMLFNTKYIHKDGFIYEECVNLIGVPISFINEHNIQKFINTKKIKK